jgi:hypothetical protein
MRALQIISKSQKNKRIPSEQIVNIQLPYHETSVLKIQATNSYYEQLKFNYVFENEHLNNRLIFIVIL